MIQKITITRVYIDKEPTQYGSFKTAIKTKEYGDRWLNGFAKKFEYKENDTIELDIEEVEYLSKKTGKTEKALNWKFVNNEAKQQLEIANLSAQIKRLKEDVAILLRFKEDYQNGKLSSDFSADNVNARIAELKSSKVEEDEVEIPDF